MSFLRAAVFTVLLPGAVFAQEGASTSHHLRISGHLLPEHSTFTARDPVTGDVEGTADHDSFKRLRGAYLAAFPLSADAAFLLGVNGTASDLDVGVGSNITQIGGGVEIGVAATPAPNFAFEFVAQGGFGLADGDDYDRGHYGEFGLAGRPVLRFGRIELFAEIGFFWQHQKLDDGQGTTDLRTNGAQFGLGGGLVF